ncbi:hypothetical protein TNCV_2290331 [Trichonephila clavipes]|uniref:Uncharacterized protein n=1 Tax=Trichonephila clavipes TaxID=2585209 RepID=A0A8X6RP15_TRICX|nr:hypothetical protein TNCV_2290331 [Trichonephila clavipes]
MSLRLAIASASVKVRHWKVERNFGPPRHGKCQSYKELSTFQNEWNEQVPSSVQCDSWCTTFLLCNGLLPGVASSSSCRAKPVGGKDG